MTRREFAAWCTRCVALGFAGLVAACGKKNFPNYPDDVVPGAKKLPPPGDPNAVLYE